MNIILFRKWIFLSIFLLVVPSMSSAMSSNTKVNKNESAAEPQRYFWYDGDEKRSVWVNPGLIAEFKVKTKSTAQLKSLYATKEINPQWSFVHFLKVEGGDTLPTAVEKNMNKGEDNQFSPVLHDASSLSGTKKTLPGNVLVQVKPNWSQEKIETWFNEHSLIVIKPLTFAQNTFLIQSMPGLDSLDVANRIYETGDVVLASPNWWQEMVAR